MALGGGTFLVQNKILPGAYINFVSMARATATLSDRGFATIPLILDWGIQGEVFEVTTADFQKNSMRLFGYDYTAPQLKGLRDFFQNIRVAYLYRLGGGGAKASNEYATAMYAGARGNDLRVAIGVNVDDDSYFDVSLYLDSALVDRQVVQNAEGLTDNGFVKWDKSAVLKAEAGVPLTGGVSPEPTNADYQAYLDLIEGYNFNAIGCPSNDPAVKLLFTAFTKRLRDEQGVKFQCVTYNPSANTDYEGVIDVLNAVKDEGADEWSLVWWVTGVVAGTAVNKSATNKVYDGEFTPDVDYTQTQLEKAIKGGKFMLHRVTAGVGTDIRVLMDINSFANVTLEKGEDFKSNQTIRVLDQIANDIAVVFNTKYLGVVPNDEDGRISLWADICHHHEQLQTIRAIEDFNGERDVQVFKGDTKKAVVVSDKITPVNAMAQLYMTVYVA